MKNLKYIVTQTIRGCGWLPVVGEHPGTGFLFVLLIAGFLAGAPKGFVTGVVGFLIMGIIIVPLYLYGAYDRAVYSDKYKDKE